MKKFFKCLDLRKLLQNGAAPLLLWTALCVPLLAQESSMELLMEASRPRFGVPYLLSAGSGFPEEVLVNNLTSDFENVNLIEEETDGSPMQNESAIAANPLNPQYLIASAVDYRSAQSAWVYVSSDGGHHWRNINLGKPTNLAFVAGNDPSVAWDYEGRAFYVYGGFDAKRTSGENGVFISISSDNGTTWNKHVPVIVHAGTMTKDSAFEDKYYISVDNAGSSPYRGHLYMPWKRVIDRDSSTQIVVTKSKDHGLTWSTPIRVSDILSGKSLDTTFGQSFPILNTGPNGEVYVAWNYGPLHSIGFNKSTDGGATWGTPRLIQNYEWLGVTMFTGSQYNHTLKGGTRVESYPSLVVDTTHSSRRGWLYLSWAADKTPNVYFSRSTDGGSTWSTPKVVHSETANDQYWQWMALDGTNGDLAVMYLDSRDDPANRLSRCYVSISRDGGDTWIDRPADNTSFDIRRNPFGSGSVSGVFAGDYSGCAFIGGKVFPSHVDMRNTYPNTADNDVYTSVININAPMPVENFKAATIVTEPTTISLSWTPPTRRVFGELMANTEFRHRLYRDNSLIQVLDANRNSFVDSGLSPYTKHDYRMVVVAIATPDSSVERTAVGYAGGAAKPMAASLLLVRDDTNSARLTVRLPSFRADSVNALVNLHTLRVYRDSLKVEDILLKSSDTSLTLDFSHLVPERGYYAFAVSVLDAQGNESDRSPEKTMYIGPVDQQLIDTFDDAPLARYLRRGSWAISDESSHSAPNCVTESVRSQYRANARDTLTLFPLKVVGTNTLLVSLYHAAICDKGDSGYVEAVYMNSALEDSAIVVLGAYNRAQYTPWTDNSLNVDDWKGELFTVPCREGQRVALRLRFKSNIVTSADGWFVDDIKVIAGPVGVEGNESATTLIYPNPAESFVTVRASHAQRLKIVSLLGETLREVSIPAFEDLRLDLRDVASGSYLLVEEGATTQRATLLRVVH